MSLTGIFAFLYLIAVLFRWNNLLPGWAEFSKDKKEPSVPGIKDATVAAIFVVLLQVFPSSFEFVKIFTAKKRKDLPPNKPQSAILWFRFIDKNINYGYMFTFGSAFALLHAATLTELDHQIGQNTGKVITDQPWNVGILMVVAVASILCNVITPLAACTMWLPFVLLISSDGASPWPESVYLAALGVGIGSNLGFCLPFQYIPAYYCNRTGKVPILTMIKYSIPSVIICAIILYLALILYAPILWDSKGFMPVLPATNVKKDAAKPDVVAKPEPGEKPDSEPEPPS